MMRIVNSVCTILFLLLAAGAFGQPNIPPDPPSAAVPISGIEWLLLSGGILGASKILKTFRNRK
jgi:hypothetical protein